MVRLLELRRGAFISVKHNNAAYAKKWWLAQLYTHVYADSKQVRICWFDEVPGTKKPKKYIRHILNDISPNSIICSVKVRHSGKGKIGKAYITLEDAEVAQIEEMIKNKVGFRTKTDTKDEAESKTSKRCCMKAAAGKRKAEEKSKAATGSKRKSTPGAGGKPSKLPKMDPSIPILATNPYLDKEAAVGMISPTVNSFLLHKAVINNCPLQLSHLFNDVKSVSSPFISCESDVCQGALVFKDIIHLAIDKEDLKLLDKIKVMKNALGKKKLDRVGPTESLLQVFSTGLYNPTSLGVRHIRSLTQSRGARQGMDAFQPLDVQTYCDEYIGYAAESMCSLKFYDGLVKALAACELGNPYNTDGFVSAVRAGNVALAAKIVEREIASDDNSNFNLLHKQVLSFTNESLAKFKAASCHKKSGHDLSRITPLHCAAVNPNPTYLKQLLRALPETEIEDGEGFKLAHYAAVCITDSNIRLLITFKVDLQRATPTGVTPLHWAARVGAAHNIRAILDQAKTTVDTSDELLAAHQAKQGLGGVNVAVRSGRISGHTALTLAVAYNRLEAVKALLEYGADVNKCLGASKKKMSPLMIAATMGNLEMCRTLYMAGAKLRAKDRHGCTVLHHSVMYNQTHCVAYFLRMGCDLHSVDSSGNTAVQYAAAHGWLVCLRFMLNTGADVSVLNSWGVSALEVAVLRCQVGVVEYLLDLPTMDVNFRNSQGATLVMTLSGATLSKSSKMIEYLIKVKQADLSLVDNTGCNVLHYLACQTDKEHTPAIIKLVLDSGVDINSTTEEGKTALIIATERKSTFLIPLLIELGANIVGVKMSGGANILHYFSKLACKKTSTELLEALVKSKEGDVKTLLEEEDDEGYTPLHLAGKAFLGYKKKQRSWWCSSDEDDEDSRDSAKEYIKRLLEEPFNADCNRLVGPIKVTEKTTNGELKNHDSEDGDEESESEANSDDGSSTEGLEIVDERQTAKDTPEYTYHGKRSLINFIIETILKNTEDEVMTEALDIVLSHRPNLNQPRLDGMSPLHIAITANYHYGLAVKLIAHGADVFASPGPGFDKDNKSAGIPPVILAASYCLELVDVIMISMEASVREDKQAVLDVCDPDGMNILHHVVKSQSDITTRIKIVEKLLSKVDDINLTDNRGNSYLHYAVSGIEGGSNISIEIVSLILQAGANPNLTNNKSQTPLHFAFITNFISNSTFSDPIEAVSILTSVMDKSMISLADSYNGFTPLHLSAMKGGSVTSLHLISHGCDVEAVDNQGNTPLTLAMAGRHQSCVLLILQKGVDFNKKICYPLFRKDPSIQKEEDKKKEDKVPWKWAALKPVKFIDNPNHSKNMSVLYEVIRLEGQGIFFTLVDMMESSFIPLEAAIVLEKFNLAITLILKYITKIKQCTVDSDEKKRTLLHTLCLTTNTELKLQERVLNLLIKHGSNLDAEDVHGCTALHYACLKNKHDIVKTLLTEENVNKEDGFSRTPICALFWNASPSPEIIKHFVDKGANLAALCDFNLTLHPTPLFNHPLPDHTSNYFKSYPKQTSLLGVSILRNDATTLSDLLTLSCPRVPDSDTLTPLIYTIKQNNLTLINILLNDQGEPGVDILHKDAHSNTVLHYCMLALDSAEYSSAGILKAVLAELKVIMTHVQTVELDSEDDTNDEDSLDKFVMLKNSEGQSVLDICAEKGYSTYSKVLSEYVTMDCTLPSAGKTISIFTSPDYDKDCKEFLSERMKGLAETKAIAVPDEVLDLTEADGRVVDDSGRFYDILMTKIDIRQRTHGIYNFYKMQIVHSIAKDVYILMTKWGRIGDSGQHQQTPFSSLEECRAEFCKVFKTKSKNEWSDVDNFVNHKGKYRLVAREKRYRDTFKLIEYDFKDKISPPNLPKYLTDVIREGVELKTMSRMLEDDFTLDVNKQPFGFIQSETLAKGQSILDEIEKLVTQKEKSDIPPADFARITQQIYDLTNDIYYLVPQKGFSITRMYAIGHQSTIDEWRDKITNLQNMEVINRIMAGSQRGDLHPVEYIYRSLRSEVTLLKEEDPITQLILRALHAGSPGSDIIAIYSLTSEDDKDQTGDCKMLYHGVNTGTLLSILKRGLLNAPFGRSYGAIHGEGVYLTDHFKKSLGYTVPGSQSRFVFIASVKLGRLVSKHNSYDDDDGKDGKIDTLHIKGKLCQDPQYNVTLRGAELGLGQFTEVEEDKDYSYEHSEYVVKDATNIQLRYLVQIGI